MMKLCFSQNVMINILTRNNGVVAVNQKNFLEVSISNTSAIHTISPYKIKPQISFPTHLVTVSDTGHLLPIGWTIISNKNGVFILSNGSDAIAEFGNRTILIAFKGKNEGAQSAIVGTLYFSNGEAPGLKVGAATKEDNLFDNSSSSSIKVTQ